ECGHVCSSHASSTRPARRGRLWCVPEPAAFNGTSYRRVILTDRRALISLKLIRAICRFPTRYARRNRSGQPAHSPIISNGIAASVVRNALRSVKAERQDGSWDRPGGTMRVNIAVAFALRTCLSVVALLLSAPLPLHAQYPAGAWSAGSSPPLSVNEPYPF